MITVSVVSHGHRDLVLPLLRQLLKFSEVSEIILTLNISESIDIESNPKIKLINNSSPKGFGENHNAAFQSCNTPFFCVLNPDISFVKNPFPRLLITLEAEGVGLVAPLIKNTLGGVEDSARHFLTPLSLMQRYFTSCNDSYTVADGDPDLRPEWVAGMFMLFKSSVYQSIGGFDKSFYLYVEDVDLCTRLWIKGYRVVLVPDASVIHDARRSSHIHFRFLCWHLSGLLRYFSRYLGRLPDINKV